MHQTAIEIYKYIKECVNNGYPPTMREICGALGIKSTSTVHKYINMLAEEGWLEKQDNQNRAIKICEEESETSAIPLVGEIAAGTPILAIENIIDYVEFCPDRYYRGDLFALKIRGDSMIEAGIFDGDIVIIERSDYAENGDICAIMVDDEYATVKTFYKENGHFRLQPENDDMEPIIAGNVRIIGKVVNLIRYF